jgi:phosphohistidine phosphatase
MAERVLVLIRHAKAVAEAATDAQRRLEDRGRRDAEAAGRWLESLGVVPDLVVVSPAVRARETWDGIATSLAAGEVRVDERVYHNTIEALLSIIEDIPEEATTLVLVGHNPSMHGLALTLDDGDGDEESRIAINDGYPTCGITVLDVTGDWAGLVHGTATIRAYAAPRG